MPKLTLTVEEAAKALGIGRSLAYKMARDGRLPTVRMGRRLLVPISRLDDLLRGQIPMIVPGPQYINGG